MGVLFLVFEEHGEVSVDTVGGHVEAVGHITTFKTIAKTHHRRHQTAKAHHQTARFSLNGQIQAWKRENFGLVAQFWFSSIERWIRIWVVEIMLKFNKKNKLVIDWYRVLPCVISTLLYAEPLGVSAVWKQK